jgi:hypothetical protein
MRATRHASYCWNSQPLIRSSFRLYPMRTGRLVFPARQTEQDDRLESERGKRSHVGCLAPAT